MDKLITLERDVPAFLEWLQGQDVVALDTETTGLDPYAALNPSRICGISFYANGDGFYLPFRHGTGVNLPESVLRNLVRVLSDRVNAGDLLLKTWNGKFDLHMMNVEGFDLPVTGVHDAMLAAHLLNENEMTYALKKLSDKYLSDESSLDEDDLYGRVCDFMGEKLPARSWKGEMWRLPADDVSAYAISDTRLTWDIDLFYSGPLEDWDMTEIYHELSDYLLLITRMEAKGIQLDIDEIHRHMTKTEPEFNRVDAALRSRAEAIILAMPEPSKQYQKTFWEVWTNEHMRREDPVGYAEKWSKRKTSPKLFNPGSPSQVKWVFEWEDADKEFLEGLTEDHPDYAIAQDLLDYRVLSKMNGTYYDAYLTLVDGSGKLRPNYHVTGTTSGRLSCSKPNIQNVPRYTERRPVKDVFVSSAPDRSFIEVDYAQAELRIAAHYAQERALAQVLADGGDPHGLTAEKMGVARHIGKTLNFAVIYGAGPTALMKLLRCEKVEAIDYLNGYFDLYPGFKRLAVATQNQAERDGYIRMASGRYRHFKNPYTGEKYFDRKFNFKVPVETRKAMNALIQGTASEMLRIGMTRLDWEIREQGIDASLLFQVHDSVMIEAHDDEIDRLLPVIRASLTDFAFDPPPDIDGKFGKRWGQLTHIDL